MAQFDIKGSSEGFVSGTDERMWQLSIFFSWNLHLSITHYASTKENGLREL